MAGRDNVNQQAANEVVRESLGLTADDLGINPADDAFTNDDDGLEDNLDDQHVDQLNNDVNDDFGQQPQHQIQEDDLLERSVPQPAPQPQTALSKKAEVVADRKGNLIDRKTGQIVARAGSEARMYQKLHRTTQAFAGLQAQHDDVVSRLNRAVELGTGLFDKLKALQAEQTEVSPQRYGLSNTEAIEALNFAKEAKVNPVETIKKLLTRAASSGIDLTSIGLSGGNFDPKSLMDIIRGEINTAMNPLKERSQRETQQEQQQREATERKNETERELKTFLTENPEAREYLPVFQRIYSNPQLQNMSLNEVWARLQLNLLRRQQQQPPSNQRPANQRRQQRPLPKGRNAPPGRGRETEMASVDTSYEDIIRGII